MENTFSCTALIVAFRDHLHIRGEYFADRKQAQNELGSPPHTWRIPTTKATHKHYLRITSTYVENTQIKERDKDLNQDHLHIRGEYVVVL